MKKLHRSDLVILSTLVAVACLFTLVAQAATPPPPPPQPMLPGTVLALPTDSPRWELQANAKPTEYQGRKCLMLDGGAATVKDLVLRDGVVDVDVFTPATRGFFGIQFRVADEGANGEWVHLRQHKAGAADAMPYTPVLNTGLNWQLYTGAGFTGAVAVPRNEWFHLRLELTGAQAKLFVKDMDKPALVMPDLKSGNQNGQVAPAVLTGATCFSNFEVRATLDAAWQRQLPTMPVGTLTDWQLSPAFDAQNFRDPAGFLGTMDVENDAIYLPLKKGDNELLLAVSELGGGWGFIARLADGPHATR